MTVDEVEDEGEKRGKGWGIFFI